MSKLDSQTQEILIETLRVLVADESVQVEFIDEIQNNFFTWNQRLAGDKKRIEVPQISKHFRAPTDLAACYILFHDSSIHQQESEQEFFDEFERVRVIAEVKNIYRGAAQNILEKIRHDLSSDIIEPFSAALEKSGIQKNLSLILLDEIFSQDFSNAIEKNLSKKIIREIKNLSKKTSDQSAFAQGVAKLLDMLKKEEEVEESKEAEEKKRQEEITILQTRFEIPLVY